MTKNIIGWAVEHVLDNEVDTRYVRNTEAEADELLTGIMMNDMFPDEGYWRKVKAYA